ncbi:MAG: aldehyde ferredoxin oxidoreductase family protein [Chloroflexi bacterium]|nr:aldehyde ferredoxin oxidoreductase family protein [Chloroflexota bacterium]
MDALYGYRGFATVVDLTTGEYRRDPIPQDALRATVGGIGLGTWMLHRYGSPIVDHDGEILSDDNRKQLLDSALSPDNPLIFVTSPLVGTRLTTSSKFAVMTRSPLTGFIADGLSSSHLAVELKRACGDALVIAGRSEHPALLHIDTDGVPHIRNAGHLLGLSTLDTEATVKQELDDGGRRPVRVACIGPAGENLVRFASIANDGGRQAGRCGPGAVMGSKNLKAIAVRGNPDSDPPVAHPEDLRGYARDLSRRSLGAATAKYRELGTIANVSVFNRLGTLPTRNFQQSTFEDAEAVSGEALHQTKTTRSAHCANCTIGCEKIVTVGSKAQGTQKDGEVSARLEYESLFALGPLVGVGDPDAVIRAVRRCDELGLDTISAGGVIAWAMETAGRGLLPSLDLRDGADLAHAGLNFGDGAAVIQLLEDIGYRRGVLGNLLADGTRLAAERVGGGSGAWAMQVKGLEMPGYEPRSLKTLALGLATTPRGACHNRTSAYDADFSPEVDRLAVDGRRGKIAADSEDFAAALDSLIWCKFLRRAFGDFWEESAAVYRMVTGWDDFDAAELRRAAAQIADLKKRYNQRWGWRRSDDTLPDRALNEPLADGVAAGVGLTKEDLDRMIDDYYRARGWTTGGRVEPASIVL